MNTQAFQKDYVVKIEKILEILFQCEWRFMKKPRPQNFCCQKDSLSLPLFPCLTHTHFLGIRF